ncbi:hypothetical protein Pcinc_026654 [Petrolisthes cinctipes]|uniref:Solute carrier family 29 member 3 n=1 Tax=Petrolisthes cinctipes TaxID=88211 RepID=A0AAE1F621_PETCI|nr:hypothetical protein Pcinc_026654 [Petrolisthes cinctipes]
MTQHNKNINKPPLGVSLVFYLLGNATLLPWNFLITAESYWQYKVRDVTLGDEWNSPNATLTSLQISFTPTLIIIANVCSTAFFIITSTLIWKISERVRIGWSLVVALLCMLLTTVLTLINSDSWQTLFFVITMVIVAFLNASIAVTLGSCCGLAGIFPDSCMTSWISGQALAGVLSSLARLVSLGVGGEAMDPAISGLIYFLLADAFLSVTIAGYMALRKTSYYVKVKEEVEKAADTQNTQNTHQQGSNRNRRDLRAYLAVLSKIWPMGTTQAITLAITISVFPAVVVYITSSLPDETRWTQVFYQPTITFLLFNVGDFMGREMSRLVKWPGPRGWLLHVLGVGRVVFVLLLLLCYGHNKTFPTLFYHDAYYIIINSLFSFTNGYIITLTYIYYTEFLDPCEYEMGGGIMVALSGIGVIIGSLVSPGLVKLWGPV